MRKYINKVNQYLIEKHPIIWNTKIVWMLAISYIIHLVFYVLGYTTLTNPESLQERGAIGIFFKNGVVFFSVILSILLLVVWLIYLFKNNAFKNFYPTSKLKLFFQFINYFIIILCATTFYITYTFGIVSHISKTYPDKTISEEIIKTNNAAVFFSKDIDNYTVSNLNYPAPFFDLYCEQLSGRINYSKSYLTWLKNDYQFYSLNTKERLIGDNTFGDSYADFVFKTRKDSIETYYYKDTVVDVSNYLATAKPRYYNYSNTFYISENDNFQNSYIKNYNDGNSLNLERKKSRNKYVYELLNRNDLNEIKNVLNDVFAIFDKYKIEKNISADKWFDLIYNPTSFEVKSFIRSEKKTDYNYVAPEQKPTLKEKFTKEHITDFYIDTYSIKTVFDNIQDIKTSKYYQSIHFFIWLTFFFSIIIFMFRISGLKPLLFTIVSVGVLAIFVALLTALFAFIFDARGNTIEFFSLYTLLFVGLLIYSIPLIFRSKIKKIITSICLNISLIMFPLFILLIISIVSMHQRENCYQVYGSRYDSECYILFDNFGFNLSYILFGLGIIFIFFYSSIIKKWKALPEG